MPAGLRFCGFFGSAGIYKKVEKNDEQYRKRLPGEYPDNRL